MPAKPKPVPSKFVRSQRMSAALVAIVIILAGLIFVLPPLLHSQGLTGPSAGGTGHGGTSGSQTLTHSSSDTTSSSSPGKTHSSSSTSSTSTSDSISSTHSSSVTSSSASTT